MRKFLKPVIVILIGIILAFLSTTLINRGRPPGYVEPEFSCQAYGRECVGDYLYGWPFISKVGFLEYDIKWFPYILNVAFWALMAFSVITIIQKGYSKVKRL